MTSTYGYSRLYKILAATLVSLEVSIYSVSVIGWQSLVYVFRDAHFYSHLCTNASADFNRSTQEDFETRVSHECREQEEMLNLVFTVTVLLQVAMPLLGYIYDHFGFVCARGISITLTVGGALLMAMAEPGAEWLLFPGASFHYLGGSMLLSTDITMPLLFPTRKTTLRSYLNGAASMSAFSLLLVKLAYDSGIHYRSSLICFAAVTFLIAVPTTFFLPPRHYDHKNGIQSQSDSRLHTCTFAVCKCFYERSEPHVKEDDHAHTEDTTANLINAPSQNSDEKVQQDRNIKGGDVKEGGDVTVTSHVTGNTTSFLSILKEPLFWWSELWFAGNILLVTLYFGSFNAIIDFRSNKNIQQVSLYTDVVGYVQLVVSMPASAALGYLVDRQQRADATHADPKTYIPSFLIGSVSGLIVWILCAVPNLEVQFVAMVSHCVLRSGVFGIQTAFVAYAFPIAHFGKIYTVQRALMAVFGGLQYPLFHWYKHKLHSDPLYFSLLLVGVSCLTFGLPVYVAKVKVKTEKEACEDDAIQMKLTEETSDAHA
ncbi:solute carrier family 43 member 3 [Lingula anatina]|uniref:Solute carrier family 43 member 3 n=1 Tax=Lingula anatina TaxID=7574 RepID=A0A1S3K6N4_LINAN|nr:solute carrier family 43 member 3 [Lingula anatina]|eukprot:XP_013418089.1 solute carrier family 43 member 3 [Lingula anatina]